MNYLLDTCVISDFVKGEKNTLFKLKNTSPSELAVSSITVMEIQYGLLLPTLPRDNAVTFHFRVYGLLWRGLAPL